MVGGSGYVVAVAIRAMSNLGPVLQGNSAQVNQLANNVGGLNRRLQLSQYTAAGAFGRMANMARLASTAIAGIGAEIGGSFLLSAVDQAGQLELALKKIQIASGATDRQMAGLNSTVVELSTQTAQSVNTITEQMLAALRAGMTFKQLNSEVGNTLIKFGDILQLTTGMSAPEGTKVAVQFAHMFAQYSPDKVKTMTDDLYKLMQVQPETANRVLTQAGYGVPIASVAGIGEHDTIMAMAMMGQVGLMRGKGGTGLANTVLGALGSTELTGHRQIAKSQALRDLGLMDAQGRNLMLRKDGTVDLFRIFEIISKRFPDLSKHVQADGTLAPGKLAVDLERVFGKQGMRFVALMSRPATMQQWLDTQERMGRQPTVDEGQRRIVRSTYSGLKQLLTTNIQTAMTEMAYPVLKTIEPVLSKLGEAFKRVAVFFTHHPEAGVAAFGVGLGLVAIAAATAVKGIWQLTASIWGLNGASRARAAGNVVGGAPWGGAGLSRLAALGGRALPIVGWITAIVAAIVLLAKLPDIAVAVRKWYDEQYPAFKVNVFYAAGQLARVLVDGVSNVFKVTSQFAREQFSNKNVLAAMAIVLGGPGGALWGKNVLDKSVDDALKRLRDNPTAGGANAYDALVGGFKGTDKRRLMPHAPPHTGRPLSHQFTFHFHGDVHDHMKFVNKVKDAVGVAMRETGRFGMGTSGTGAGQMVSYGPAVG